MFLFYQESQFSLKPVYRASAKRFQIFLINPQLGFRPLNLYLLPDSFLISDTDSSLHRLGRFQTGLVCLTGVFRVEVFHQCGVNQIERVFC
jgi:hypothetical protein